MDQSLDRLFQENRDGIKLRKNRRIPRHSGRAAELQEMRNAIFSPNTPEPQVVMEEPSVPPSTPESILSEANLLLNEQDDGFMEKPISPQDRAGLLNRVDALLSDMMAIDQEKQPRDPVEKQFEDIQKQFDQMKRLVLENTVVSSIGVGSSGGGGEVELMKMDDVDSDAIADGQQLTWNESTKSFKGTFAPGGSEEYKIETDRVIAFSAEEGSNANYATGVRSLAGVVSEGDITQQQANEMNLAILQGIVQDRQENLVAFHLQEVAEGVTPREGDLLLVQEDGNNLLSFYVGGEWAPINGTPRPLERPGLTTPATFMEPDAPTDPQLRAGDLWVNTGTLEMSVYYIDQDSSQWVAVSGNNTNSTTTTIEALQDQISALQTRIGELENATESPE